MERLTEYHVNKTLGAYMVCSMACIDDDFDCNNCEKLAEMVDRLAAYEDTGLEPCDYAAMRAAMDQAGEAKQQLSDVVSIVGYSDINRLKELARAEKDGRLVVLPCKVGDTVWTNFSMSGWYFRDKDKPYSARVFFIGLNDSDAMGRGLINVAYGKHNYMSQFSLSDIGKSVFLTREEAEAALKKREEDTP